MDPRTAHALIRFGLGPRGAQAPPGDPVAWLAGQLDGPDPALAAQSHSAAEALVARRDDTMNPLPPGQKHRQLQMWEDDSAVAARTLLETGAPLRERLVWFWANHFTVSLRRGDLRALVMPYVREAIRPFVTSRFADMLAAVMHHPAMLSYLDNTESFGPDSPGGLHQHRGLNENLARECLELHTVSPAAGYTQTDVTAFARVLTGWTVDAQRPAPGFAFLPRRHQPGPKSMMGRVFAEGEAGGEAALAFLGQHPATYRHIAWQMVQHFAADAPDAADVAQVAAVLGRTQGDLKAAMLELLRLPSAWQKLTKLRQPWDYTVAVLRALDLPENNRPPPVAVMQALGQPFMTAPLPNGWADTTEVWADGELLLRRADWAMQVSGRALTLEPMEVAECSLGPLLSPATRAAVQRAPTRREALALLFASPEFYRR
jgi:uncharacterized protein (DUF1800 family)